MLILVGPSASGKTEVGKILEAKYGILKLVTYTTRERRIGEIDGVDYNFISKEDFVTKMNQGFFFETVLYSDNYYGTALEDIKPNVYVILDPVGLNNYKHSPKKTISFFFNVPEEIRIQRMKQRLDSIGNIERRISFDRSHFSPDSLEAIDVILDLSDEKVETIAQLVYVKYTKAMNEC